MQLRAHLLTHITSPFASNSVPQSLYFKAKHLIVLQPHHSLDFLLSLNFFASILDFQWSIFKFIETVKRIFIHMKILFVDIRSNVEEANCFDSPNLISFDYFVQNCQC